MENAKIFMRRSLQSLFGKIICAPTRLSQKKLSTKFEVSSTYSFEYVFHRMLKNFRGRVT